MRAMFAINALATNDAFTIRCLLTHITNDREDKTSGRRWPCFTRRERERSCWVAITYSPTMSKRWHHR